MSFSFPSPNQLSHLEDDSSSFPYPDVPVDKRSCRLLGPTALVVQALMGVLVIASLVLKRQRETPMRPWRIWLFDVSKQIIGQAFVHGLNLLISDIVANLAQGNPCDLYFLNVLIDTTLGVAYIYLILHAANMLFTTRLHLKGFQSGQYGDPPSIAFWARQATVYVLIILTMKLLVIGLFAAWPGIFDVAEWLLSWTAGDDKVQVIFVMGVFPILMNILQFWLIDSIVKASASISPDDASGATNDGIREPLFRDPNSDEEDDDTIRARRRHDIESPPTPAKPPPRSDNASEHKSNPSAASSSSSSSSSSSRILEPSSIKLHAYPPDLSSSSSSLDSPTVASPISTTSSSSSLRSKKSKRRSPPPPIQRPPPETQNGVSYMISMTPSPEPIRRTSQRSISSLHPESSPQKQARQRHRSTQSQSASRSKVSVETDDKAWDGWVAGEADADDWAQKVGEEEWTGRRLGATRAGLDVWGAKGAVEVS